MGKSQCGAPWSITRQIGTGLPAPQPEDLVRTGYDRIICMYAGILASVCRRNLEDTGVIIKSSIEVLDLIQLVDRMMDSP